MRARLLRSALFSAVVLGATDASAQQPSPYPPPQGAPPYAQPGGYPQQGGYAQPGYAQPGGYPQQGGYAQPPPAYGSSSVGAAPSTTRSSGEMVALYITSTLYGIGTGVWLDALFKIDDPGSAIVLPLALGAAAPIGVWAWDSQAGPLHRGVPPSVATGLVLGGIEGIAIAGTQWQYTRDDGKDWSFATQTTVTWIMASAGGVGGWAFGEWIRPDPRSMTFIGSGAGWGALSGAMLGIAVQGRHADWKDGSSVAGLIGYNVGMLGAGALSIAHTPSYASQKYMWLGYGLGALAGSLVFPFYLFVDDPVVKRGLLGPALGGLAGAGIAGAITFDMKDPGDAPNTAFEPPFDLAVAPIPALVPPSAHETASSRSLATMLGPEPRVGAAPPGAMLTAVGSF